MALRAYLERSANLFRKNIERAARMEIHPETGPRRIFSFSSSLGSVDPVDQFSTGSDQQLGGTTTAELALVPDARMAETTAQRDVGYSHLAFYGYMSTAIPPSQQGKIRTGFAGFRNASRSTLFGQETWDLDLATHLKVVVGYRGWEGWRNRWVVNVGVDDRPKTDIFQHRLEIPPSSFSTASPQSLDPLTPPLPIFSTLYLPLSSFVLIQRGQVSSLPVPMPKNQVRTVGFALLGRDRDDNPTAPAPAAHGPGIGGITMGGWGKASLEAEYNPELKRMLEEDQILGSEATAGTSMSEPVPSTSGKYHRAGKAPPTAATDAVQTEAVGLGDKEGYYELCLKRVEAIRWDPELEQEVA
ncbi:uncharacterized protein L203_104893 [Cryptococcus depauperatus CBS 7841]|uniref:Uncharacterized protein n=1 Tax=Cryptococcus depauperatus CBS 7841 TaxID=1295531 RepID=A0A1E3IQJ2_9TREE|nr:hypothetical protein L203_01898 [Cryptococcus depauperatus CBS 7841]